MEKFCPNCGKKLSVNAKFCPNCGYDFSTRHKVIPTDKPTSQVKKVTRVKRKNHKAVIIFICIVIAILIVTGAFFLLRKPNDSSRTQAVESSKTYSKVDSNSTSRIKEESSKQKHSKTLSTDMGPKGTAAAITYYAAKDDIDGWSSAISSDSLTVDLSTEDSLLDSLSSDGQGMAYVISGSSDRKLIYTIDKDDTINIYSLPENYDQDKTYDPVKSIAKDELIKSLNNDNYGNAVEKLKDQVEINQ